MYCAWGSQLGRCVRYGGPSHPIQRKQALCKRVSSHVYAYIIGPCFVFNYILELFVLIFRCMISLRICRCSIISQMSTEFYIIKRSCIQITCYTIKHSSVENNSTQNLIENFILDLFLIKGKPVNVDRKFSLYKTTALYTYATEEKCGITLLPKNLYVVGGKTLNTI